MAHRAPPLSITYKWTYDVFLSFYGDDAWLGFVRHLYESLRRSGIHAFIDYEIRDGENSTPALLRAIEKSRIAIIVFSENYANSTFCLQELEKIVDCFKEEGRLIYPIFYYVDPSELRRPRGSYAQALARLEERFKDNRQKVEKWRQALSQAVDLKGCHLKPTIANEQECITRITSEVAVRINLLRPLYVANYPVGLVSRVKEVISLIDLWSTKEIKIIAIWGAGGIGKSTIARAVYNSIADNFEGLCFLPNVREQSQMPNGLAHLQETLLCKLVMEKDLKLGDYHEGIPIIKHRLSQKKILLILDDVDKSDQLKAVAGSCDWFGYGSRIIITTRNKQLLKSQGIKSIYEVKEFNGNESLKLLTWYAFKKDNVDSNYVEVCNRALDYSRGLPLALQVIGSNLHSKAVSQWRSELDKLKSIRDRTALNALKLSDDMLSGEELSQWSFTLDLTTFDQWVKMERIGAGGFGIVYVGSNRTTGEKCAIKEMLHIDNLQTAHSVNQEVQILSRLEHQNIVKYYGSKIVNGQISIYMEYIEPGSLRKYIKSREALQESLVQYFTAQILSGLVYLHNERVVHRDIKPDNILVDSKDIAKLVDFGLAKHLAQSVGNHSKLGTVCYAAPEVIRQEAYKSSGEAYAADIWSLGCVVIEMFTGTHPWPNCSNLAQIMFKVCFDDQDPEIPENLSLACKDFLKRCFIRDPAKRPSAVALLNHPFVITQT